MWPHQIYFIQFMIFIAELGDEGTARLSPPKTRKMHIILTDTIARLIMIRCAFKLPFHQIRSENL